MHVQDKVDKELKKLLPEGHIKRLDRCTGDCCIAPIVITVKKYDSLKVALDAKLINRQIFRKKQQIPNAMQLEPGTLYFTVLDLYYAYVQSIEIERRDSKTVLF